MGRYLTALGGRLRAERMKVPNLAADTLSREAEIGVNAVRLIELGHNNPTVTTLVRVCKSLARYTGEDWRLILGRVLPDEAPDDTRRSMIPQPVAHVAR